MEVAIDNKKFSQELFYDNLFWTCQIDIDYIGKWYF